MSTQLNAVVFLVTLLKGTGADELLSELTKKQWKKGESLSSEHFPL